MPQNHMNRFNNSPINKSVYSNNTANNDNRKLITFKFSNWTIKGQPVYSGQIHSVMIYNEAPVVNQRLLGNKGDKEKIRIDA